MGIIMRLALVILVTDNLVNSKVLAEDSSIAQAFQTHEVVPDILDKAPDAVLSVKYPSGAIVNLGNELKPIELQQEPNVSYEAESDQFYTLVMLDLDVPSRKEPELREVQHWLVGNIPGCSQPDGETLSSYLTPNPTPGTKLHRYVFLVYRQPEKLTFQEIPNVSTIEQRINFCVADFAKNYNLGDPIAGSFFQAQFNDRVEKTLDMY